MPGQALTPYFKNQFTVIDRLSIGFHPTIFGVVRTHQAHMSKSSHHQPCPVNLTDSTEGVAGLCRASHSDHAGLTPLQVAATQQLWSAARSGVAASCLHRVEAPLLAVMILGEMRDMNTQQGLAAVEALLATLQGTATAPQLELFLHVSVGDSKPSFSTARGAASSAATSAFAYRSVVNMTAPTAEAPSPPPTATPSSSAGRSRSAFQRRPGTSPRTSTTAASRCRRGR